MSPKNTKTHIQLRLDREFLAEIDTRAYGKHISRNAYILTCIQQVINIEDHNQRIYEITMKKVKENPKTPLSENEKLSMRHWTEPFSFL